MTLWKFEMYGNLIHFKRTMDHVPETVIGWLYQNYIFWLIWNFLKALKSSISATVSLGQMKPKLFAWQDTEKGWWENVFHYGNMGEAVMLFATIHFNTLLLLLGCVAGLILSLYHFIICFLLYTEDGGISRRQFKNLHPFLSPKAHLRSCLPLSTSAPTPQLTYLHSRRLVWW